MDARTVLVVEDNELNMKLVRDLLKIAKYNVLEATDAESGCQMAREHSPALILMDIQLPGMDGLSATRLIKADPVLKAIPVIALTSYAMQGDEDKAREAGCDGYIAKPIDTRNFLKKVDSFLAPRANTRPFKQANHKNRILIVDDEPLNVKLLEAKLTADKYEFSRAFNGEQALEKAEVESPDLILLDIMMPDLYGFEVTRRLKANSATRDIPIILVTALEASDYKVVGHEAGADEFLNKPVKTAELQARVRSLLHLKEYQDELKNQTLSEASERSVSKEKSLPGEKKLPGMLLVMDNAEDAKLVQMYLHGQPYWIDIAPNVEAAVARARKSDIDLILLDVMLQGEECFETCRRLKEGEPTKNIQVLLMTLSEDLELKHKQFELWADDFLIKPVNVHELRARVKALVKKKTYLDRLYAGEEDDVHSAISDRLSGLANHAYFKYFLTHEIKRSLRDGSSLALVVLEVRDFNPSPNSLGHPAGEGLLRDLGTIIHQNIREVDLGARCREKKFAVVLPKTNLDGALKVAKRLQKFIRSHCAATEAASPATNFSLDMGIAVYPSDADSMEMLLEKAQSALSQSKRAGRNRIGRATPLKGAA
ncbi:MAG: response regulator [Desulfobacterales bacterium]|nr:MAG: response regulator [Desulfobacterales bacterium]